MFPQKRFLDCEASQSLMRKSEKAPLLYSLVEKKTFFETNSRFKKSLTKKGVVGRICAPYFSVPLSNEVGR